MSNYQKDEPLNSLNDMPEFKALAERVAEFMAKSIEDKKSSRWFYQPTALFAFKIN